MSEKRIEGPPELNQDSGRALLDAAHNQHVKKGETLVLDLATTESMDSRGGAWLMAIADYVHNHHAEFRWEGEQKMVADFIQLIEPSLKAQARGRGMAMGIIERIGATTLKVYAEFKDAVNLTVDAIYWTLIGPFEGRGFRWGFFFDEMHEMGVRAIRVNIVMNFLLGLTIAMLSAAQVADFGLGIYVADLIIIGFARELAALMTAVVVSARTGAAIAAEIATMEVQEEIDALRGMGLNTTQFLVAPKLLALIVVMPILVSLGVIAGIIGGAIWGIFILGFPSDAWFHETFNAADLSDFTQGMIKALSFAVIIVMVGCHNGFRVTGGSRGVGLMTTRAVVMDIFFIVLIDMCFAVLFYYVLD